MKMKLEGVRAGACGVAAVVLLLGCASGGGPGSASGEFRWASGPALIAPPQGASPKYYGVKDPSVVHVDGRYHVFMTTAGDNGWGLAHASFEDWSEAPAAPIVPLDKSPMGPGYRAAPQVFYFAPQRLWYLVYQGGDPMYSTSKDVGDPLSWSAPRPFFATAPDIVRQPSGNPGWLDFWVICDDRNCYLFFTNDGGAFFRAETPLDQFPKGFHNTTLVMKEARSEDLFEASNTYKVAGTDSFITVIEASGSKGRYFRAWKSHRLDGEWTPLGSARMNLFAGSDNVGFDGRIWSEGVSHGEMLRAGVDQTMTIDPCTPLKFLYQGLDPDGKVPDYLKLPYRLGVITAVGDNPVRAMCPAR